MDSKFFFFLFFSSWASLIFSQDLNALYKSSIDDFLQDDGNGSDAPPQPNQCVQKLLPCQPYLHKPSSVPASCCLPLTEMVENEVECLCSVITNPAIMKSFNVTEQNALDLAKACGANADMSKCNNPPSPTSPVTPPAANSSTNSSSSDEKNAGQKMHSLEKSSFIVFFMVFIFLAFSA